MVRSDSPHRPLSEERSPTSSNLRARAEDGARRADEHLRSLQHPDGHWCGELEGNTILESETVLLMVFLGRERDASVHKAAEFIRRTQEPHGGWGIYPGGPTDVSTSVKAYFVLKLMGDDPDAGHMERARDAILRAGGVEAVNSFTHVYLAVFGQYPWGECPAIVPEIALLPSWSYFNLHEMSSWSRGIVVPLSVIWASRPVVSVPSWAGIRELYTGKAPREEPSPLRARMWRAAFRQIDRGLKLLERAPVSPLRRRALARAETWMLQHMDMSDGLGAIYPPIVYSLLALRCLGYRTDHPRVVDQLGALERLFVDDGDTLRVQPCKGPVWDTSLALRALTEHRPEGDEAQEHGVRWLLAHEALQVGDWIHKNPYGPPGGWPFQYENAFYPDCDDTAQILTDLVSIPMSSTADRRRADGARRRGLAWLLSMQSDDGGWAAFDKNCDKEVLCHVPFADHNAMIDPSCADITGRVLVALADCGLSPEHRAVRRAVAFLERAQDLDGAWYGRWGCNYVYGTSLALQGLAAARLDPSRPSLQLATRWLRAKQNDDGGWGESFASYEDRDFKGRGESTSAQTSWALLGLLSVGDVESRSVQRGVEYLIDTQEDSGGWRDRHWTGTGFPRVFYMRYALYERYFPLLALAAYVRQARGAGGEP